MTYYYWGLGTLIVACVVVIVLFRVRAAREASNEALDDDLDFPLWEAEQFQQIDFWPELVEPQDGPARAFHSPPEWRLPKPSPGGNRHSKTPNRPSGSHLAQWHVSSGPHQ
jgi:hypothetical protein